MVDFNLWGYPARHSPFVASKNGNFHREAAIRGPQLMTVPGHSHMSCDHYVRSSNRLRLVPSLGPTSLIGVAGRSAIS